MSSATRKGNWADYGERVIPGAVPGEYVRIEAQVVEPHYGVPVPHWHAREVERMRAQLVECRCGFWLPHGRECPVCGRRA